MDINIKMIFDDIEETGRTKDYGIVWICNDFCILQCSSCIVKMVQK